MRLDEFDYHLPEELIALRPVRPRPASRLLVAGAGQPARLDRGATAATGSSAATSSSSTTPG